MITTDRQTDGHSRRFKPSSHYMKRVFCLIQERGLTKSFKICPGALVAYLTRVEDHYRQDIPYHNATHAADVTQSSHVLLAMPALHVSMSRECCDWW